MTGINQLGPSSLHNFWHSTLGPILLNLEIITANNLFRILTRVWSYNNNNNNNNSNNKDRNKNNNNMGKEIIMHDSIWVSA